jgi:hypothetical protein
LDNLTDASKGPCYNQIKINQEMPWHISTTPLCLMNVGLQQEVGILMDTRQGYKKIDQIKSYVTKTLQDS